MVVVAQSMAWLIQSKCREREREREREGVLIWVLGIQKVFLLSTIIG